MDEKIIKELQKNYNTPAYIFDINELKRRVKYLRKMLPENVELCYAIKANTFIVKDIEDLVDRFEVCSPGEYYICKEEKIDSKKILISGVYKTPEVIEDMIKNDKDLNCYSIESLEQFELLKNSKSDGKIPVMIRITSGNQFGVNEEDAIEIIKNRSDYEHLEIKGIQYFSGTQKRTTKRLEKEVTHVVDFIKSLKEKYGYETEEFEFGPGLPVYYFEDSEFDEDEFLNEFAEILRNIDFKGRIILELGRAIAASCGSYITKVVDKKINKGLKFAIVDGGMNHIVYYGQSMAMKIPKSEVYPKKDNYDEEWNLCGSLCTINDILVKQFPAGDLKIGDLIIFKNTGAYCMTEGISLFLSRDLPYVFKYTEDKKLKMIRENIPTFKFNM